MIPRVIRFLETESGMVIAEGGGRMRSEYLMETVSDSGGKVKKFRKWMAMIAARRHECT